MMDVISACPLRVASILWQPRPGSHALTVVCKATFELRPGESPLAAVQQEPSRADAFWNEDPRRGLRVASDLSPFKRRADLLVVGHAYANAASPVASLTARVAVGSFEKAIDVHAERAFAADGRLVLGEPFVSAPLGWERAAWSANNPAGIAANAPPDARGLRPVPSLVPRGFELRGPTDTVPLVGLGPVAPTWYPRTYLLGRHASIWDHRAWNTRPLPEDLDGAFFNAAPIDQQIAELRGDETIVLEHLHASHALLTTRLAKVSPSVIARRESGEVQDVRLRIDTLCIDTDRGIASLVWRGVVMLARADEPLAVVLSLEGPQAAVDPESTLTLSGPMTARTSAPQQPVLPFVQGAGVAAPIIQEAIPQPAAPRRGRGDGTGTIGPWLGSTNAALPFQGMATPTIVSAEIAAATAPIPVDEEPDTRRSRNTAESTAQEAATPTLEVEKPPMVGPIAMPEQKAEAATKAESPTPEPAPATSRALEPEAEDVELSLEKTAALAAELAEGKTERKKVLDAHGLREKSFRKNEARWKTAMDDEALRGTHLLRARYDAAYVAQVEAFRGPIELDEYARIVTALERGQAHEALDALKIQRPALMSIVRLWTKKVAKDMKLGAEARKALQVARRA